MGDAFIRRVKKTALKAMPIPREDIVSGNPVAKGVVLFESKDGCCSAGIWSCTPGAFKWEYTGDETCTILYGEAEVKLKNGRIKRFLAGDIIHFPRGLKAQWVVKKKILKTFTFYEK
ncbi:MAG: cupin domain-containing protein [Candidatus Omnitrophica bacterium]|nr:cupin domain-containing protein [Candidatus Omnitrophota bacterium]